VCVKCEVKLTKLIKKQKKLLILYKSESSIVLCINKMKNTKDKENEIN
jgi:hypothetical protein